MKNISFIDLDAQQAVMGEKLFTSIKQVLEHGKYIMGPEVAELEEQLARFCGAKHAIACSSGTDALLLALMAKGVGPGDAVFLPSFTFVATAEVVALLGATPYFVDVDPDYFLISVDSLKHSIKVCKGTNLKPKGIIPVDLFGQPASYAEIKEIAEEDSLFVVADGAQSFGGSLEKERVGVLAEMTTTSFFPAKPLGCYGDGGAVFTNNDTQAELLRSLLVHGKGKDKYDNIHVGINGRIDTIQAAILIQKLSIFEDELAKRNVIADRYDKALKGSYITPRLMPGAVSAWAQYTLKTDKRNQVIELLRERNIPTAIYYPKPLHQQSAYKEFPIASGSLPVSEELSNQVFSIPMHPYLGEELQDHIISGLLELPL